jgi:hypothetical protein
MWPRATTSNRHFNKAVTDAFDHQCGDPRFFDEAGEDSFYTAQVAIRRNIYMLHDYFGQFLRPGEGSLQPTMNFIPSWMIGNPAACPATIRKLDQDGTRANEFGRISFYRAYKIRRPERIVDVPAGDMLHFHEALWKGQRRGMSPLTPAARKWFSLDDIDKAADSGELMRTRLAYAITRSAQDDDEPTLLPGASIVETIENDNPDGTKTRTHIQRIVSQDGTDIDIADLAPGRDLKTVESNKGHDAVAYKIDMLTDIARCTKYPPVYVFFVGGLTQGTEVRWVTNASNAAKTVSAFTSSSRSSVNAGIPSGSGKTSSKAGSTVEGGVPQDWYLHRWNLPADDSVDVGREGRLMDERLDTGKITPRAYHAVNSEDAEDVVDEIIEFRVNVLKKIEDPAPRSKAATPITKTSSSSSPTTASSARAAPPSPSPKPPPTSKTTTIPPASSDQKERRPPQRLRFAPMISVSVFQCFSFSPSPMTKLQFLQTPQLRLGLG